MSFQPVVPIGGIAGWAFLQRTRDAQEQAFETSAPVARATQDFADRIGEVRSAADLVSDRRLLGVALDAFGLGEDIDSRFFVRKVLEEGSTNRDALANRLADKRYLALSEAFGFGDSPGGNVARPGFAESILDRYTQRRFEAAIGESNTDMRLVLGLERELGDVASRTLSNDGKWFVLMATPPLRTIFEQALGLPKAIGTLDVDRQLDLFKTRAETRLGTAEVAELADPEKLELVTRAYLVSSELSSGQVGASVRGSAALALLQQTASFALN